MRGLKEWSPIGPQHKGQATMEARLLALAAEGAVRVPAGRTDSAQTGPPWFVALAAVADLDAGDFGEWLDRTRGALRRERDADVPCDGCTACCTSSQFVHI